MADNFTPFAVNDGKATASVMQPIGWPAVPPASPYLTGNAAKAITSASGGHGNGTPAMAFPGGFTSQSFVDPNQTLQQAVDAAPASSTLVSTVTTGIVDLGSGVYGVPFASKPAALFFDAQFAMYSPASFSGNTMTNETATGNQLLWTWDAANSRAICYNAGAAVTTATSAKFHAVVAIDRPTYDSVVLRPGIVIVGAGREVTEIRNLTYQLQEVWISGTQQYTEYSLVTASYSGVVDLAVVRNNRVNVNRGFSGIVVPTETNSDWFVALNCHIYMEEGAIAAAGYNVGIWWGATASRGSRAKNCQFIDCLTESFCALDVFETYSGNFNGLVIFRGGAINGTIFIDGATNTFILIDCPYTNLNSHNRDRAQQPNSGFSFAMNMGSLAPFAGYSHCYIAINSPHRIQKVEDVNVPSGGMYAMGFSSTQKAVAKMSFRNSPITADKLVYRIAGTLNQSILGVISAKGSPMPAGEVTTTSDISFSLTSASPLIPRTFTQQTVSTATATPRDLGALTILLEDLQERGEAKATVRGKFAANTNTKSLQVRTGVSTNVATITLGNLSGASVSSTYNGLSFEYSVTLRISGSTVLISGYIDVAGTVTRFQSEKAVTAAQYFQITLLATGATAAADVTCNYQLLEIAG